MAWGWAAAAALLAGVIGAYAGWRVGASALPTTSELRIAAASLAPQRFRLEGVSLVDRGPSLSRPLWDVGGSRYAQADLRVSAAVDPAAVQAAIATKARNAGWRRAGATSYERDATKATVEITELGPAASDVEVAIRGGAALEAAAARARDRVRRRLAWHAPRRVRGRPSEAAGLRRSAVRAPRATASWRLERRRAARRSASA